MTATIQPIGALKTYTGNQSCVSAPAGISIRQALNELKIPSELVALVLVNGQAQNKDYILRNEDEVRLLAVLGGG